MRELRMFDALVIDVPVDVDARLATEDSDDVVPAKLNVSADDADDDDALNGTSTNSSLDVRLEKQRPRSERPLSTSPTARLGWVQVVVASLVALVLATLLASLQPAAARSSAAVRRRRVVAVMEVSVLTSLWFRL
jgi:hypothetical protein